MLWLERPMLREAPAHKSRPRCHFGADGKFGADGWGPVQGPAMRPWQGEFGTRHG